MSVGRDFKIGYHDGWEDAEKKWKPRVAELEAALRDFAATARRYIDALPEVVPPNGDAYWDAEAEFFPLVLMHEEQAEAKGDEAK